MTGDRITALDDAAREQFAAGNLDEAARLMEEAVAAGLDELGLHHSHTLSCVRNAALIDHKRGRTEDARQRVAGTLAQLEAEPEKPIEGRGMTRLNEMAMLCSHIGDATLEQRCHEATLRQIAISQGEDHTNYAAALNNLAEFHRHGRRFDEALPIYRRVLEHPGTPPQGKAVTLNNMALVRADQGEHSEAIELLKRSIEIKVEVFGRVHASVASGLETLSVIYAEAGMEHESEQTRMQSNIVKADLG